MRYQVTKSIDRRSLKFGLLYGRMQALLKGSRWEDRVTELLKARAALAAITVDKNLLEKAGLEREVLSVEELARLLGEQNWQNYQAYYQARAEALASKPTNLSLAYLQKLHADILKAEPAASKPWRTARRLIPRVITENGLTKQVEFEVKTHPSQINKKTQEFIDWYNQALNTDSPLILAGISHFKMVKIHPFVDGNGRLGRVLEHIAMEVNGDICSELLATEVHFLQQSERYYAVIAEAIDQDDITVWLEFYTEVVLSALLDTIKIITKLTAGAIDVEKGSKVELSNAEAQILDILSQENAPGPAEIAKQLGYSRQNIYKLIRNLNHKGLIRKQRSKYNL